MVLNDTRKRGRSVSRNFEKYQFYEKENKPNSMKCGFKTNKLLTAVKDTDHTITTSEGRVIHKKLASKPLKFQTSRRTEEKRRAITRCRKCGKFSHGELCETHQRQDPNNNTADNSPSTSHTHYQQCRRRKSITVLSCTTPLAASPIQLMLVWAKTARTPRKNRKRWIYETRLDAR